MIVGLIIFGVFALMVGLLIYKFEHPNPRKGKATGRGGDFES